MAVKPLTYPAKSGIVIRKFRNRTRVDGKRVEFRWSYQVDVPVRLTGKRQRSQFSDIDEAKAHADAVFDDARKHGQRVFGLTADQREDALKALTILDGTGATLESAVAFWKRHRPPSGEVTVRDVCDRWLAQKEVDSLRPRTIKDAKNRTAKFCETFGPRLVHDITKDELTTWLQGLESDAATLRNWRLFAASLFRFAIHAGNRVDNPATSIRTPKVHWKAPVILTVVQARNLLATAKDNHPAMLPFVTLGLFCGLRTTELSRLDWSALNLEERRVTIGQDIAKKRKTRSTEIPENAVEFLMLHPTRKGPIAPKKMDKKFRRLVIDAGFANNKKRSTWGASHRNAMRHSFASYLYAKTEDSARVSSQLGHAASDTELFDHYRASASKRDAEAYFSLRPGLVSSSDEPTTMEAAV